MRTRRVLKIAGVLFVALVVAAVAWALNLDPNSQTDRIARMVKNETGRDISFGGPIELDLGLTTRLILRDVRLSNADWSTQAEMLHVGLLDVRFRLLPLLGGSFQAEDLTLRDTSIRIETHADGRSNLDFGSGGDDRSDDRDGGGLGVGFASAKIENLVVSYTDGVAGSTTVFELARARAVPSETDGPLEIVVEGDLRLGHSQAKVDLEGRVGSLRSILSGNDPVPVMLAGEILGFGVEIEGGVRQADNPDGFDVDIAIKGDGLGRIEPFVGTRLPELGPISLTAHVAGEADAPVIENIRIDADGARITGMAKATMADDFDLTYDLKLALDGQSLRLTSIYTDMPLDRLGPLTGSINVIGNLERLRLEPNAVTADNSQLSGAITVSIGAKPPAIDYDVSLTADAQTLAIIEPFVGTDLPDIGPINGVVRAIGDRQKARIEVTDVRAGHSTFTGRINLSGLDREPALEYDVSLSADGQSLDILRPYVEGGISGAGTISGDVRATGTQDSATVTLDALAFDRSRISGTVNVANLSGSPQAEYDIALEGTGQTLDFFEPLLGVDLPDVGPLDLEISMKGDEKHARVEKLSLRSGDSVLSGSGEVDLRGTKPRISAQVTAPFFDLTRWFPDEEAAHRPELISREEAEQKSGSDGGASERVFPNDPLPIDFLSILEADVSLKAGELITPYGTYRDTDIRVVLDEAVLDVRPLTFAYGGGDVRGSFNIDARAGTPLVNLSFSAPNVKVGQVLKDFADLDVIEGQGRLNVALSGAGRSVAEIMASLNGHTRVLMAKGRMRNEGLGYVSGVFSGIGELLDRKEWVIVEYLATDFEIRNGVATSKVGVLDTEVIAVTMSGNVDLGKERYNLKISPSPRGLDLSLAVPVNVRGPLDDPSFGPDPVGSLAKIGSLISAVVFPPVALLGLTELGGNDHPCVQFAKTNDGQSDATPNTPLETRGSGGGIGGAIEGLRDRLDR
jgi:uncharacterized protein involved in outer membrane biogenesis